MFFLKGNAGANEQDSCPIVLCAGARGAAPRILSDCQEGEAGWLQDLPLASNWHPIKRSRMRRKKRRLHFISIPSCFQICKFRPLRSIPIHIRSFFLSALVSLLAADCTKCVLKRSRASKLSNAMMRRELVGEEDTLFAGEGKFGRGEYRCYRG